MQTKSLAEQLSFVTVRLEARNADTSWTGTGFVHGVDTERGTAHFLITNRHVLQDATELDVNMIRASPDRTAPVLGQGTLMTIQDFGPDTWSGHPRAEIDIAAMPLSFIVTQMAENGAPPFYIQVGTDVFLTPSLANDLDAIEDVVFVGYPNGIYDRVNLLPVMRRGMTATPVAVDYSGIPSFLMDGSVYPGSSGSPVFLINQGVQQPKTGGIVIGAPRLVLLGVLASVHVRNIAAAVVPLPAKYVANFQEPIGLGIVYKAETIGACVAPLLERAGVHLSGAPTSSRDTPELSEADERLAGEVVEGN
jgi:hypothetical protein